MSKVGRKTGLSGIAMTVSAARAAIADAGLVAADIDGLATVGDTPRAAVQDSLGLRLGWGATVNSAEDGNASGAQLGAVIDAALAVASGLVRHVLVYRTVQMKGGAVALSDAVGGAREWMLPFHEYSAANMAAMVAQRHVHDYGTTREQLGAIALTARKHAALNEQAVYRSPMTMADYLGARPISEPLGLYDCDVPVDGSVAVVVSAIDHQRSCPNPAVRFAALGAALQGRPSWDQGEDYPRGAAWDAAAQMWSRTDLTPADVDVAEVYDGFTILTLDWLEALGFCGMGEGGAFVEAGTNIGLDGALPLNTYGGQLSAGRLHGYWLLHEACLQIRGQAGARQVDGAEVAVAAAGGGPLAGCLLLTR
ncbi:thiolase family protein [Mycobacterium sp. CVI_P3]|uniref:Thiolase family protein n=1 Tax=Mycobacterium pinniadriaticum TaxID=2994102 RepID=A0ABT3SF76_9MYCO|nr:thiolase family protein [Mycobacterium pinniadriaticum]MCX2931759.1 thiolase family protein [Mycobacterium pinniadriaticum]MCX2938166.1 thiolase family protein [Mycobacterium pinniadriaticum]